MKLSKTAVAVWAAVMFVSAVALAQTAPVVPPLGPNVMITIALGGSDGKTPPRTFEMLTRDQAPRSEMLIGWRVPIPTGRASDNPTDGSEQVVSYVYQNVGVTARLAATLISDGKILLQGDVEASGSKEGPAALQRSGEMPIVATFQQTINVIVQEGKPLRVAQVPDHEGGQLYMELTARVQR